MSVAGYLVAGTAQSVITVAVTKASSSWTAEGRITTLTTKYDVLDQRHQDFLDKAHPILIKKYPNASICLGAKATTHALNKYEPTNSRTDRTFERCFFRLKLRRNEVAAAVSKGTFWQRLSPYFKSDDIKELDDRLVELDDTTLVCSPEGILRVSFAHTSTDDNVDSHYSPGGT